MLSDNIRKYRKENNMSQDELAEKLGVSRQSISLWETGQTQPTIDNIIALSKIFNISVDALLDNNVNETVLQEEATKTKSHKKYTGTVIIISVAVIICAVLSIIFFINRSNGTETGTVVSQTDLPAVESSSSTDVANITSTTLSTVPEGTASTTSANESNCSTDTSNTFAEPISDFSTETTTSATSIESSVSQKTTNKTETATTKNVPAKTTSKPAATVINDITETTKTQATEKFDLFSYCKNYAITKGKLNGDYSMYQQPATRYGGYENEYFSISYWGTYNKVEFCLHCPLDETLSINFYLIMRGSYNNKYEFLSSKYFRSNGESLRSVSGHIDPSVFSDSYPLSFEKYEGSIDGQDSFLEESRVGICDLIRCLKKFVNVENMECDFSAFDFKNF